MNSFVTFGIVLLLALAKGEHDHLICRNCGKVIANATYLVEGNSPSAIGYDQDELVPEEYGVVYEEFDEVTSGEYTKFYYVEEIEEESVSILPEKKTSTHFPGFLYQTVICRICKQPVGYLYSPTLQDAKTAAYSASIFQSSIGSYLDYCPYTKCWDIHRQIVNTLDELDAIGYNAQQTMITLSKEFAITKQVVYSQTVFDIDMIGVWSDNTTAVFGYNYHDTPPSPFYSLYLPRSNTSMHIDLMEFMEKGEMPILAINVGEGEGMTEVRFVFCDAGKDRMKIRSFHCPEQKELACTLTICMSEFGIPPSRTPGSFFALFAEDILLDTPKLDDVLDSIDRMYPTLFGFCVCSTI